MFYFSILNLPSIFNSKLQNIFPFKTKYLNEKGFDFILRKFMREIRKLKSDDGLQLNVKSIFNFKGIQANIHAKIIVQLRADSKGAREIGGFMSTSADRFCLRIMISKSGMKQKLRPGLMVTTTIKSHDLHVESAQESGEGLCRESGVKYYSLLNNSKYLNVVDNCCFNLFHELFEGVISFIFKILCREFILYRLKLDSTLNS